MQLKKLPYLLRFVPNQYKIQQICYKAILERGGALKSVLNQKNQEVCNKADDNHPECYKTQTMHDKVVDTYPFTIKFVPKCHKTQEMCKKAVNRSFLYLILFLIGMKLKKCGTEFFLRILF